MPAELTENGYYRNFIAEAKSLPEITWQDMLKEQVVIQPKLIIPTLQEAKNFLVTQDGPNKDFRKKHVPNWFNNWFHILSSASSKLDTPLGNKITLIPTKKLLEFDNLAPTIKGWGLRAYNSGMLNLAGGEGHVGHLDAARIMSERVNPVIWGFEQESYFLKAGKKRGGSFLPLEVRLSMWSCHSGIHVLTVLPERIQGVSEEEHYEEIFRRSGAIYSFAEETDPYHHLKISRGGKGADTTLPHVDTPATTELVHRLMPDVDLEMVSNYLTLSIRQSIETP